MATNNSFSPKNILEFINTKKEPLTKMNPQMILNYYLKILKKSVLQLKTVVQSRNYSLLCIEIISLDWIPDTLMTAMPDKPGPEDSA